MSTSAPARCRFDPSTPLDAAHTPLVSRSPPPAPAQSRAGRGVRHRCVDRRPYAGAAPARQNAADRHGALRSAGGGSGGGSGGGVGYSLGNRKALIKPLPKYVCNESGKVVVEVIVDKNGNTISAVPGIKGTTNTAKCLLDQAKVAAMNTKWQSSESAPETQRGNIVYNFSISQ